MLAKSYACNLCKKLELPTPRKNHNIKTFKLPLPVTAIGKERKKFPFQCAAIGGTGWAGSPYDPGSWSYPAIPFSYYDFNDYNCDINYQVRAPEWLHRHSLGDIVFAGCLVGEELRSPGHARHQPGEGSGLNTDFPD